ncbi:hypothetical protein P7K49_008743, partial [Saguinus oedipus]
MAGDCFANGIRALHMFQIESIISKYSIPQPQGPWEQTALLALALALQDTTPDAASGEPQTDSARPPTPSSPATVDAAGETQSAEALSAEFTAREGEMGGSGDMDLLPGAGFHFCFGSVQSLLDSPISAVKKVTSSKKRTLMVFGPLMEEERLLLSSPTALKKLRQWNLLKRSIVTVNFIFTVQSVSAVSLAPAPCPDSMGKGLRALPVP